MKARELLAVTTAAALTLGGCGTGSSEEIGCGQYLGEGPATVQSLAKALQRCWENLPDELKESSGPGYTFMGRVPTTQGNMFFSVQSETPISGGIDEYAADAGAVFITTFPDGDKDVGSSLSVANQLPDQGILYTQWIDNGAEGYREVRAGKEAEFPDPVVTINPPTLADIPDRSDPELVKCVQDDALRQFAHAVGTVSDASELPHFSAPPLTTPCNRA